MRILEWIWFTFFLAGWLLLGVLGTSADTTWFWCGAVLLAAAGAGSLLAPWRRPVSAASLPCLAAMLLFWAYMTWRGLYSDVAFLARRDLLFGSTALIAYLLVAVRFTGQRHRLLLLGMWSLLVLGNVVAAVYQYYEDPTWTVLQKWGVRRASERNGGGFFSNANHLCGFLTMAALPALAVAVLGRGVHVLLRMLCGIVFVLAGVGVALSTSRGGLAAFAGGTLILALLATALLLLSRRRDGERQGGLLLRIALLLAAPLAVLAGGLYILRSHFNSTNALDLNSRGPLWDLALAQWERYFFFGGGARSYEYIERSLRTIDFKWMTWLGEVNAVHVHNDYLQILADYGLIGFVLALAALAVHTVRGFRVMLKRPLPEGSGSNLPAALCAGVISALAGTAIQAMVEFNFHIGVNVVMAGALLGLLANPGRPSAAPAALPARKSRTAPDKSVRPIRAVSLRRAGGTVLAAGVSVVIIMHAVRFAPADHHWRQGRQQWRVAEAGGLQMQDILKASGSFQRTVELDPENAEAWQHWGFATLTLSDQMPVALWRSFVETSYKQFMRSLAYYPQNPYTAAHAGQAADYLKRFQEAEEHFDQALRWGQNIQRVNALYADHLFLTKQYYKAIGYYINAIHLSSDKGVRGELRKLAELCRERLIQNGETVPGDAYLHLPDPEPKEPAASPPEGAAESN